MKSYDFHKGDQVQALQDLGHMVKMGDTGRIMRTGTWQGEHTVEVLWNKRNGRFYRGISYTYFGAEIPRLMQRA